MLPYIAYIDPMGLRNHILELIFHQSQCCSYRTITCDLLLWGGIFGGLLEDLGLGTTQRYAFFEVSENAV